MHAQFGPTTFSWYFNMILAVYFVLGVFMFQIGKDPAAHKSLIGFVIWSSVAHFLVLVGCVMFDDTPSYSVRPAAPAHHMQRVSY